LAPVETCRAIGPDEARAGECGFGPRIFPNHADFRGKSGAGPARSGCLNAIMTEWKASRLWPQQLRKQHPKAG
jgi:hypothetical protein